LRSPVKIVGGDASPPEWIAPGAPELSESETDGQLVVVVRGVRVLLGRATAAEVARRLQPPRRVQLRPAGTR
jgi:hypothetical protein